MSEECHTIPVLLLTGPVGVGKTAVLGEVLHLLEERGISHAGVDIDALTEYFPRPPSDRFGSEVGFKNLAAVWQNYQEAGAERLVVASVIETKADLDSFRRAVPGAQITLVRLRAPVEVLQARVRGREHGAGLEWHVNRAAELAERLEHLPVEHVTVDTENLPLHEVAEEVLRVAGWLG